MTLLLIVLACLVAALWRQVRTLRDRVELLEAVSGSFTATPWSEQPLTEEAMIEPMHAPITAVRELAAAAESEPAVAERPWGHSAYDASSAPTENTDQEATTFDTVASDPAERGWSFEDVFGRRLPIWAGGVTLAVAGFLIVRFSIAAGLLSPPVRVMLGLLFGSALIVSAEAALRFDTIVRDGRVRQALAGAGIATLYAMILAAANLYHLIGAGTAFAGMTLITALAGGLSVRFGAPSAVLGLVGGLAAPALVGSDEPNVPLLTLYLVLAVGGLCALGRQQRWRWLGAAALTGGFGWGTLLVLHGALDLASAFSVGLYTLSLAIGLPILLTGERAGVLRVVAALVGCAQLAALIAIGGFAPLHWGLFGLISIAIVWLSRRDALFAEVPAMGLGVAILLAFAWPHPAVRDLTIMLMGMTAIYGGPAIRRVWREDGGRTDAPSVAAIAFAIGILPALHSPAADTAFSAMIGALLAGAVAAHGWTHVRRGDDTRFATLVITAAFLLGFAGLKACAEWLWPPVIAALAFALFHLAWRARDKRILRAGWTFGVATLGLLVMGSGTLRLFGEREPGDLAALTTWVIPAALATMLAWRADRSASRILKPAAVLIGYGAAAQILPTTYLPLAPVVIVAALAAAQRGVLWPSVAAATTLMAGWALAPLGQWVADGAATAVGVPIVLRDWPTLADTALRVALPGGALLLAALRMPMTLRLRDGALAVAGISLTIAAHVGYKHLFAIDVPERFVARAFAERTLWEMLLAGGAIAAWRFRARLACLAFAGAALLHFAWFTGVIANPLWVRQDVELWLVPAFATAGGLLWLAPRALPETERQRDWALMALIMIGAFMLLRQMMHAPMLLSDGTAPSEQIARSVLAITLAGGFLWTGIARHLRDWRIASLGLMLVAVAKVFLFDAAGLDGLARIVSFAALGFSLIGVGWLYSRYLPDENR